MGLGGGGGLRTVLAVTLFANGEGTLACTWGPGGAVMLGILALLVFPISPDWDADADTGNAGPAGRPT